MMSDSQENEKSSVDDLKVKGISENTIPDDVIKHQVIDEIYERLPRKEKKVCRVSILGF